MKAQTSYKMLYFENLPFDWLVTSYFCKPKVLASFNTAYYERHFNMSYN